VKFKVDENLPIEVAERLQQAGYDVITAPEQHLSGSPDPDVASICQRKKRAFSYTRHGLCKY